MASRGGPVAVPAASRRGGASPGRGSAGWLGRIGLAPRLFLSNLLVIAAGSVTLLAVAVGLAPALFHEHLRRARLPVIDASVRSHVDEAFDNALSVALVGGAAVATLVAAAVSWLVAGRLAAPVHYAAQTAQHLADGHHEAPVPDPRLGPEFASLTAAMNRLSRRLEATEADRRRLTADLAHQLRTPLASVRATVEAVVDGVLPADDETLAVLADQTRRLHRLVDDLEKVSRAEERQIRLHPSPQPLAPLVETCAGAARPRALDLGVDLGIRIEAGAPAVRIDADRIAEALANLLDNALRHTPVGGRIVVALGPTDGPDPGARITVTDTGDGFDPAEAPDLFRRFRRGGPAGVGSRAPTGSGLGLTIARALVEAHGGTLTGTSEGPGRGATFTLALPAGGR